MSFEPRDPAWITRSLGIFQSAAFVRDVGFRLIDLEPGRVVSELEVADRHLQQDGLVHAGVQATMADHSAGTAAATLMTAAQTVLTIEFKLSLMSPGRGQRLVCRAAVIRPGRQVSFAEARVFAVDAGTETLISHATVSLALIER